MVDEEEPQAEEKPKKTKKVTRTPTRSQSATDVQSRWAKKQETAEQRPRAASIKNDRDPLIGWDAQQGPPPGVRR